MRINIAATKTNLLKVKKNLSVTREGYELLDEKRKILLGEIGAIIHKMQKTEEETDAALAAGYAAVNRATVIMGRKKLLEMSLAVETEANLRLTSRRVMGVSVPVINLQMKDHPPYFSSLKVNMAAEDATDRFKKILVLLARLAELKITTLRLAQEAQKTIRKVNALEKVYIPYYQEAEKNINDRLEEESRDAFSMLKLIKQKIKK
ncbi:MAG: V-type ATP synthase subunit D [bacterium]|nr:V-type ATP synthase subunit D [bacterium]MDD5756229.1 V-type ATP synthase subunit D [bacterium]